MRDERLRRGLLLLSALSGGLVFVSFVLWERPGLGIGHFYYVCIMLAALATGPRPFADWVLIEEKAEGGDMLAQRARSDPRFLEGYSRTCEGAGLALYRREDRQNLMLITNR